ncbi:MAG: PqqD family peptide modification chaperone [Pseudonocardiaceae bacterium]
MMPASPTSVVLAEAVSSTSVADGLVLLDERRGMIYHLNHSGAATMSALLTDGYEAAVTVLCARYAITADTARRDVTRLIDELRARRLVGIS